MAEADHTATAQGVGHMGASAAAQSPGGDLGLLGRSTTQRAEVLQALIGCEDFVSAQTLHAALLGTGSRVGLSTVYRTLTALTAVGRTEIVRDTNGERLYRYRPDARHRHYLLCRQCGLSLPLDAGPVEAWADKIGQTYGFAEVQHTVELTGTCTACTATGHADKEADHQGPP
jgi:Fur family ferric uptake transcriptional regulator